MEKETEQEVRKDFTSAPEKRKTTMANTLAFISAHVLIEDDRGQAGRF